MDGRRCEDRSCCFASRSRHRRFDCDWSSDVCSSDLSRSGGKSISLLSGGSGVRIPPGAYREERKRKRRFRQSCRSGRAKMLGGLMMGGPGGSGLLPLGGAPEGADRACFCRGRAVGCTQVAQCGGCSSMVEHWTVTPGVAGSSPVSHPIQLDGLACTGYTAPPSAADRYGSVAQLAEQWTLNP